MKINGGEEIEDWPGVYAIVNKTNGREYVGSSEKGVLSRIEQHERLLKSGKHNRKQMQEDYNNGCLFEAEIIYILPVGGTRKQLLLRETEEIQKRGAEKELYNAKNWTMSKNRQTGKLEKIEYARAYYLPRRYWEDARNYEVIPRRTISGSDLARVKITPTIREAAEVAGQSVQSYILQACAERMARDGFTPAESGEEGGL